MPLLTPIPRDQLDDVGIPLARWWSHWRRHTRYIQRPTAHFRRGLDDMGVDDLPPDLVFDLVRDYCKRLTGAQNHDWREIYSEWVNRWRSDRYNTLQLGKEIIDLHPLPVYYEWYTQQYGVHLRLSDRVAGKEVGANKPQQ
ncbi:uncharacterized protein DS421_19g639290 [Arachis hypogaea]|uniref:Aminotransferase-like plant mobile domain-containing protein n=1 Tax=Arachis hypogaea TaxID=3818 RepID=A0A6B9V4E5_ARAHY|nr:uncharacterized protein DS421_19g639290 [Arachis hypogaea]